jgi:DNA-binding phage protein
LADTNHTIKQETVRTVRFSTKYGRKPHDHVVKIEESNFSMQKTAASSNRTVQDGEPSRDGAIERLREAVRLGGGQTSVAAKSGIKMRSLSSYLSGEFTMKLPTAVLIADACGVTVEWLAAGRGPMRPTDPPPPKPRPEGEPAKLFATVNMDRLARCLDAVDNAFGTLKVPTRRKIQIASLLYDALMDDRSDLSAFLSETIAAVETEKTT